MSVGLTDDPGSEPVRPLSELSGEATTDPRALRIFGEFGDGSLDLATDGTSWWDLDDPGLDLAADDVEFLLGANAYLLPTTIVPLLADRDDWSEAGIEEVAGVTATKRQRLNIVKDRDWEYGDLVRLDVWESDQGQLLKFTAWFATGDNSGFPVTSWQITDPVPGLVIGLPEG